MMSSCHAPLQCLSILRGFALTSQLLLSPCVIAFTFNLHKVYSLSPSVGLGPSQAHVSSEGVVGPTVI